MSWISATSRHAVVARGILSDAAYAGPWLVWATETTAGSSSLQAVDARTLKPATVLLPTLDGTPRHLTGSHDYLLWTDLDQRHVTAWDLPSGKVTRFTTEDAKIPFQFFELVGHYALWYDGEYQDLMDLRTGGWVRLPGSSATAMPSGLVVATYPQARSATATTGGTRYSVVRTDQLPPLPCA